MSGWNKKRKVMRHYDQSAKVYDALYREEQEAKIKTGIANVTLNPNSLILDAGCGTGLLFEHTAYKVKFLVGTDISRGLFKEAKKKARLHQNVGLVLADADHTPFPNQAFDVVFAFTLLQNTPSPQATLDEIKRVSKSTAKIVVTGLRRVFTEKGFVEMIEGTNLRVETLKLDEQSRDYVCVCTRISR